MTQVKQARPNSVNGDSRYEVIVCGGGMAGCGAAIQAARCGASVLLIERLEMLGGLGSAGWVGNFCAAEGGLAGQGQVFDDIVEGLRARGALGEENGWPIRRNERYERVNWTFDHRYLPLVLQDLVLEAGVQILYATDVVGAGCSGETIEDVVIHNRSLTQRVAGDVFIDATGDGVLSRHAGGCALPDDPQLPGVIKPSNMMAMRESHGQADPPAEDVRCSDGVEPNYSVWPGAGDEVTLKMKLFHRDLDTSTGRGYSDAVTAMRREVPAFARHFRRHHDPDYVYAGAAPMLGLRESVRIEGDYVLSVEDCRAGRRFDGAVAYGSFTIDANGTSEILPPYQIPLKSLLVRGVENCLVVGRCFSADRLALSSARTMATGSLMGQAAGTAAALCAGPDLRAVDPAGIRRRMIEESGDDPILRRGLT
jgi:hypothetical protein